MARMIGLVEVTGAYKIRSRWEGFGVGVVVERIRVAVGWGVKEGPKSSAACAQGLLTAFSLHGWGLLGGIGVVSFRGASVKGWSILCGEQGAQHSHPA